ncbi:Vacuolar protein-sorting-associated protein 27 [Dinochytrium kinnereticum]|nr:Vacuolar protein-sorting-associated protein 27 [Dinochytrium kinnereticum]
MSFLFTNPFDDVVEKATSENNLVGHEDIVTNLEIADKIRGKEVPPKQAISSLKRRINNKNPNVQIQALKLTDACVKNSGQHFVVEVASRDFIDNLVSIVRNYPTTNQDVRLKILALLQTWGIAFKGKSELSYVTEVYEGMKREGLAFPPVEKAEASAIMIDTKTAPDWTDSDICMRCRTQFTTFNRKHHCRNCGQTFCHACSSKSIPLPHLGITQDVRVCDSCHYKLTSKVASTPGSPAAVRDRSDSLRKPVVSKEDDELQKAIAASLADAEKQTKRKSTVKAKPVVVSNDEDEDPELKAAIEASLAELKISEEKKKDSGPFGGYGQQSGAARFEPVQVNPNQLSRVEIDNLKMFVELVERMEADVAVRGIGVIHNSQISTLYSQLMILQPKLLWSLDDAVTKYRSSLELNEKITAATQMYDRLLQERLANTSGGYASTLTRGYSVSDGFPRPSSGYTGYPAPQQQQQPYTTGPAYLQNQVAPTPHWGGQAVASYSQEAYAAGEYASPPSQQQQQQYPPHPQPQAPTPQQYPQGPAQAPTSEPHQPLHQNAYQTPPLAYAPTAAAPVPPPQQQDQHQQTPYASQDPSYRPEMHASDQPVPPPASHGAPPAHNGYGQPNPYPPAPSSPRQQTYSYAPQHPGHSYYDQGGQQQQQQQPQPMLQGGQSAAGGPAAFGGYPGGNTPLPAGGYPTQQGYAPAPQPEKPLEAPLIEF